MNWDDIALYGFDISLAIALIFLLFFIVIFVHEMGHFLAARLFGMKIGAVVIGRGRIIKTITDKHGTCWDFRFIPFGAHVDLLHAGKNETKKTFDKSPYWQRMITIMGGPIMNLLTPFIIFPALYFLIGLPSAPSIVVGIEPDFAAERAGIEPGDKFIAIDDIALTTMQDIWDVVYERGAVKSRYTIQRGDNIFEVEIEPGWLDYKDDGVARSNARFGIVWEHRPMFLKNVLSINGAAIKKDKDLARELILKNLGKEVIIGLKGPDGEKEKPVRIELSEEANSHLYDEDSVLYEAFFLSSIKGNFYLSLNFFESVISGFRRSVDMIKGVSTLPFQLLPFDPKIVRQPYPVGNPDTELTNRFMHFMHGVCFISVFLGLLNLLPFPSLDGGYIFMQTIERIKGSPLELKHKATLFVGIFLLLYLTIFVSNMDNLPYYIDSRLEKLQEFMSGDN